MKPARGSNRASSQAPNLKPKKKTDQTMVPQTPEHQVSHRQHRPAGQVPSRCFTHCRCLTDRTRRSVNATAAPTRTPPARGKVRGTPPSTLAFIFKCMHVTPCRYNSSTHRKPTAMLLFCVALICVLTKLEAHLRSPKKSKRRKSGSWCQYPPSLRWRTSWTCQYCEFPRWFEPKHSLMLQKVFS